MQPQTPGVQPLPPMPQGQVPQYQPMPPTPGNAVPPPGMVMPNLPQPGKPKPHSHLMWIVLVATLGVFLLASLGFGIWAFTQRGTYKDKTDQIVAREVELSNQKVKSEKEKEFLEREKNPLKTYDGPAKFGGVKISYPKTWAAFVTEKSDAGDPISGYFHPNFVPGLDSGTSFALHLEVVNGSYDSELAKFDSKVKQGKVTVEPFRAPKVPEIMGTRIEGEINKGHKDTMIMIPLRDKTLKITTESESYLSDFDKIILPNLIFVP